MEEFGIVDEACYFCGHEQVVRFNEHFDFCPSCTAISTNMMTVETCPHFENDAVVASREPWSAGLKKELVDKHRAYIIEDDDGEGVGSCSICGKPCIADGW
jgi:5-methylcytosine-specific restriction endonuclease McrA